MITNHFSRIKDKSHPHAVFKLDWNSYDTGKFGDSFLPHSDYSFADSIGIFDGAELFTYQNQQSDLVYDLWINSQLPEITIYSFAEGSVVSKNLDRLSIRSNEIVVSMEISESERVKMDIQFGSDITNFLNRLASKNKKLYSRGRIQKSSKLNLSDLQSLFGMKLEHKSLLTSIFQISGIDNKVVLNEAMEITLNNPSPTVTNRRRKKKVIDEKGGHVIDSKGEVIWRSEDNPDNGYTWRYTGDTKIGDLSYDELINVEGLRLITKGEVAENGATIMSFIEDDFDYQNFISEQAEIVGVKTKVRVRPVKKDNFAFVTWGYIESDKVRFKKQNGWQHGGDMGSIILTDKKNIEFVWNSKEGNKINLANIYDIRSILVHENKHFTIQHALFPILKENMKNYAEEKNIDYKDEDDLEEKLKKKLNSEEWKDNVSRVWFFQIDNNFFLPSAKRSTPFMEVIAYAEQVNHEDYKFASMQLKINHTNIIFPANPNDERTTNYLFYQSNRKDELYEPGSPLTRTDAGLKFWNHKSREDYVKFIYTTFKVVRKLMGK